MTRRNHQNTIRICVCVSCYTDGRYAFIACHRIWIRYLKEEKKCANLSKLKGAASKTDALNLPLQMNMLIPYHLIIFGLNNPIWFVRFGSIRSMAGAFVFGRAHCFDSRTIDLWFDFIVSAKFSIFRFSCACIIFIICLFVGCLFCFHPRIRINNTHTHIHILLTQNRDKLNSLKPKIDSPIQIKQIIL